MCCNKKRSEGTKHVDHRTVDNGYLVETSHPERSILINEAYRRATSGSTKSDRLGTLHASSTTVAMWPPQDLGVKGGGQ